ncbi:MAG: ABC-2 family transporter protein [Chloroflexi bacterium]|nr:ABC-2 family transporter protein [Chloroflexota bacterium]MBV9600164.1 ABC-2 family transporter protein [Chloroflexota bacterium]
MLRPRLPDNAYLKTASMAAAATTDHPGFLLTYALRLLRVLVLLALWRYVLVDRVNSGPLSLAGVLTYTLIAEVFAEQLNVRTSLNLAFWEGTLVIRFLRPMGLVRQLSAEMVGPWCIDFVLFSLPLLAMAPLLGVDPRPVSPGLGALFVVSLALAILVGLAMELITGAVIVGLDQPVWLIEWIRTAIALLLSGALLPLAYYPWGLGELFAWLPFAAMAWAPLAIYTAAGNPLTLLASQLVWLAVLWPFGVWLWDANREKLVSHGG